VKRLISGLFTVTGARMLGVGVLAGMERLLSNPNRSRRSGRVASNEAAAHNVPPPPPAAKLEPAESAAPKPAPEEPKAARHFSIKRTKSEVGFVYWILEGHGRYKCFILCDTWDEAVAHAKAKLAEIDGLAEDSPVAASSLA
jgi:hypothetical protein